MESAGICLFDQDEGVTHKSVEKNMKVPFVVIPHSLFMF